MFGRRTVLAHARTPAHMQTLVVRLTCLGVRSLVKTELGVYPWGEASYESKSLHCACYLVMNVENEAPRSLLWAFFVLSRYRCRTNVRRLTPKSFQIKSREILKPGREFQGMARAGKQIIMTCHMRGLLILGVSCYADRGVGCFRRYPGDGGFFISSSHWLEAWSVKQR